MEELTNKELQELVQIPENKGLLEWTLTTEVSLIVEVLNILAE